MDSGKAPVTRGALERVLGRAAELQAAGGEGGASDALTEAQLIELGAEVGLSPDHLRQALAEERARGDRPDESGGLMDQLVGPTRVAGQRVVRGSPDVVLAALDRWMQDEEWLRVVRQRADRVVWEPRRDLLGGLRRALGGRSHALHVATDISASVAPVDADRSVAAIVADLRGARGAAIGQVVAVTGIGALASGALLILGFVAPVAALPVVVLAVASIYGSRKGFAFRRQRAERAVEQVLDRLEQRAITPPGQPSLLRMIESALPRPR